MVKQTHEEYRATKNAWARKHRKIPEVRARRNASCRAWYQKNKEARKEKKILYRFKNTEKCKEANKKCKKAREEKTGIPDWKRYAERRVWNVKVRDALSRAFGKRNGCKDNINRGCFEKQKIETIKSDIQILKREITKLRSNQKNDKK